MERPTSAGTMVDPEAEAEVGGGSGGAPGAADTEGSARARRRAPWLIGALFLLAAVALVLGGVWLWQSRPRISETEVQEAVWAAIQRESEASFLVTGTLDMTATTWVENTKVLLPGLLDLDVGSTRTEVRLPGRASYGIDLRELRRDMIVLRGDSLVEVRLPPVRVHAVDADLAAMDIRTRVGWTRVSGDSRSRVERRAIERVEEALLRQARSHVATSDQPRINTARGLDRVLRPVLAAVGLEDAALEVEVTPDLRMRPRS